MVAAAIIWVLSGLGDTGGAPVKNSSTIALFYQLTNIDKDVCIREQTVLKKYIYKKLGFMQELKLQCQ